MRHARLLAAVVAAALVTPCGARAQVVAITGGKVYPGSGPAIENATVLIRSGRIAAVGKNVVVPAGAKRIDAAGKWVTPGLFDAGTTLGLVDVGQVPDTRDFSARGTNQIAASFTVWDAVNPRSVLIVPARNEGVTTVIVAPGGGLISGQAGIIDLVDGGVADMLVRAPVAMVAQVGDAQSANTTSRGELLARLRDLLGDTREYARRKADFEMARTPDFVAPRANLEAMIPVVQGRLPLLVQTDRASDIESAIKLASDFRLRLIIAGGAEAWVVANKLAAAKVPVLTGAMSNIPTSFASLASRQENAALLRKAGVTVVLIGNSGAGDEAFNVRNIKQEAGNAVAYGMSWDDALRAITFAPAEVFGVAERVGSLQPGREANVVVWSGDPFEFTTRAEHVFLRGVEQTTPSRQDMLMQRYKSLPGAPYRTH